MILTPLQKLPKNVGDLGKLTVATGFEWLPKVQRIAQSGHTGPWSTYCLPYRRPIAKSSAVYLLLMTKNEYLWSVEAAAAAENVFPVFAAFTDWTKKISSISLFTFYSGSCPIS